MSQIRWWMSNCSHQTFPGAHVAADVTTAHFPAGGLQRHGDHGWVLVGNSAPVFGGLKEHSMVNRRKIRSQPADNMDRLKSRGGKSQRREGCRKRMQAREEKEKSQFTVVEKCAPAGRKIGSLKRRVRSHLAKWDMKDCTPLGRESHFEVEMFKKCMPLWREARFEVKMCKTHHVRTNTTTTTTTTTTPPPPTPTPLRTTWPLYTTTSTTTTTTTTTATATTTTTPPSTTTTATTTTTAATTNARKYHYTTTTTPLHYTPLHHTTTTTTTTPPTVTTTTTRATATTTRLQLQQHLPQRNSTTLQSNCNYGYNSSTLRLYAPLHHT